MECGGCEHGIRKTRCKDCGGSDLCLHGRQKGSCKECGKGYCEHGRRKLMCVQCGGKSICEHGEVKRLCTLCGGKSICEHGRVKWKCKECKLASLNGWVFDDGTSVTGSVFNNDEYENDAEEIALLRPNKRLRTHPAAHSLQSEQQPPLADLDAFNLNFESVSDDAVSDDDDASRTRFRLGGYRTPQRRTTRRRRRHHSRKRN